MKLWSKAPAWLWNLRYSLLTGAIFGLLISNLVILFQINGQQKANAQLLRFGAQAVEEIKNNNADQTRLLICLLVVHGEDQLITDADRSECQEVTDGVLSGDSSPLPASPAPSSTQGAPSTPPGTTSDPVPPAPPTVIDRVSDLVGDVIDSVTGWLDQRP